MSTRSGRVARIFSISPLVKAKTLGLFLARLLRARCSRKCRRWFLFAEGVEHFDGFGGQADDALGRRGMALRRRTMAACDIEMGAKFPPSRMRACGAA